MKKSQTQLDKEIIELCEKDQYLGAIKLYKDETGEGLKESKEYESLAASKGLKKKGCFVATACYSDYDSVEVLTLRKFRDEKLMRSGAGRTFIKMYYVLSPPVARQLEKSETLKKFIRNYILGPIVNKIKQIRKQK
jgi:hypothetical protein